MTSETLRTWAPFLGIGIAAIVLAVRLSKGFTPRPLSLGPMWIAPLILLFGMSIMLVRSPPGLLDSIWISLALAAGAGLGWQRGRMIEITLDRESGRPLAQSSPAAIILVIALMAGRAGLKVAGESQAAAWHVNSLLVTDVVMGFALGLLAAQRLEMSIRARALTRNTGADGQIVS